MSVDLIIDLILILAAGVCAVIALVAIGMLLSAVAWVI